jgi:molybdenum cofactor cytidylyltransferase
MDRRAEHPVAAVLLAAGSSRRFGSQNKLLADIGGTPLVRRVASAIAASRAAELIVVTGPDADAIAACLSDLGARLVHNAQFAEGMGGSIAAGIRAVGPDVAGALVCPADMPMLATSLLDRLIAAFEDGGGRQIVHPTLADGSQRNPVLFPRHLFPRLAALAGEGGAKPLLAEHAGICLALAEQEDGRLADIDTFEELERLRSSGRVA